MGHTPQPDTRTYTHKPPGAATEVPRALFCMIDGGSTLCTHADTAAALKEYRTFHILIVRRCKQAGMH